MVATSPLNSSAVVAPEDGGQEGGQAQEEVLTRYLPTRLKGCEVLVHEGGNTYRIERGDFNSNRGGIAYRNSKDTSDKDPALALVEWGTRVEGTDTGDGWIAVQVEVRKNSKENRKSNRRVSLDKYGRENPVLDRDGTVDPSAMSLHLDSVKNINYRMLASKFNPTKKEWIIPAEFPLPLLLLRVIFTRLRKMCEEYAPEEKLPFEAFQRSFERLFFILQDPDGLDLTEYDENGDGFVAWSEFYHLYKERDFTVRRSLRERIFITFDNPESSHLAMIISMAMLVAIMVSSCCFILSTLSYFQVHYDDGSEPTPATSFEIIEYLCLTMFTIEYVVRLATCGAVRKELAHTTDQKHLIDLVTGYHPIYMPSPAFKLVRFIIAPANLIDLAAILPALLSLALPQLKGGGFVVLRLVRLTRIFRVLKIPAIVEQVQILSRTIQQSTKALYVLGFNLILGIVIFGSLMYLAEGTEVWDPHTRSYLRTSLDVQNRIWNHDAQQWDKQLAETPFQSIPHAFWWAIVTVMTVGYGDHHPTTGLGFLVSVVAMCFSLVILALPVGLIGGKFSQVWTQFGEDKEKEKHEREKELFDMTSEVLRFDPSVLQRMILIQVWNDTDSGWRADSSQSGKHRFDFMGEAKLELSNLGDEEYLSDEIELLLVPNENILKRSVAGKVKIKYRWTPDKSAYHQAESTDKEDNSSNETVVVGSLKVTVVAAEDLINLDFARPTGVSSPFCTVLAYPTSPDKNKDETIFYLPKTVKGCQVLLPPRDKQIWQVDTSKLKSRLTTLAYRKSMNVNDLAGKDLVAKHGELLKGDDMGNDWVRCYVKDKQLHPEIWRTPTVTEDICPKYDAVHEFRFEWPRPEVDCRKSFAATFRMDAHQEEEEDIPEGVLKVLFELEGELQQMRQHLTALCTRVDTLADSMPSEESKRVKIVEPLTKFVTKQCTRFLPKTLLGCDVLVHEGGSSYKATVAGMRTHRAGIAYRRSKDLTDKDPVAPQVLWGATVEGTDEGDGWIAAKILLDEEVPISETPSGPRFTCTYGARPSRTISSNTLKKTLTDGTESQPAPKKLTDGTESQPAPAQAKQ